MRAIAFDFDGTLADSRRLFADLYNEIAGRFGFRAMRPDERRDLRKLNLREQSERLGVPAPALPVLMSATLVRYRRRSHEVALYRGVPQLIRALWAVGIPLHIVSTKEERNIRPALEREGIARCFGRVVVGPKALGKKRLLERFLEIEGLRPVEMLYVGDAPEDIEATRSLGIPSVAVTWGMATESELRAHRPTQLASNFEVLRGLLMDDALGAPQTL